MTMDLDSIVRVTATLEPPAASGDQFGRALFVFTGDATGSSRAAIAGARARDLRVTRFNSLDAVGGDFATTHVAYKAAASYFRQVPYPRRDFLTAGWHSAGAVSYILGETGIEGASQLTAIKALGDSPFIAAGQSVDVNLNQSGTGDTGYAAIASAIQTGLRTITSPDLSGIDVAYSTSDDAYQVEAPIGVDIGGVLSGEGAEAVGLGDDASYYAGVAAETAIGDALDRIQAADDSWYWLVIDPVLADSASAEDVADWVGDERKQFVVDAIGIGALTTDETTSRAARVAAKSSSRTPIIWSGTVDHKAASAAGRMASTDFSAVDSLPTLFAKALPGTEPDSLTTAQRAELDRKLINYYTTVGGSNILRPGVTPLPGWWVDTRYWLDWLTERIQTDIYTLLRSIQRLPLTARGLGLIQTVVEDVCEAGRRNGGIAAGRVGEITANEIRATTGTAFDGTLSRGYLVYVEPIENQSTADIAARKAPPVRVWLKGSGAVHFVDISLNFREAA